MAAVSTLQEVVTSTLTTTAADTVTYPRSYLWARIENPVAGAATIYARADGVVAVSAADGTTPIPAGQNRVIFTAGNPISLVGSANLYTVALQTRSASV